MARYTPTPDIWKLDDEQRAKLQPGQHVLCGADVHRHGPSRFYRFNPASGHVTAFHGPNATRKMREYIKAGREFAARRKEG